MLARDRAARSLVAPRVGPVLMSVAAAVGGVPPPPNPAPPSAPPRDAKESPAPPSPAVPPEPLERPSGLGNGVARTPCGKGSGDGQPGSPPGTPCSPSVSGAASAGVEFAAGASVALRAVAASGSPNSEKWSDT